MVDDPPNQEVMLSKIGEDYDGQIREALIIEQHLLSLKDLCRTNLIDYNNRNQLKSGLYSLHSFLADYIDEDYKKDVKVFGDGRLKTEHAIPFINDDSTLFAVCGYRYTSSDIHIAKVDADNPALVNFVPIIENNSAISIPLLMKDQIYVITQIGAPNGQILRYDLSKFSEDGTIPESKVVVKETDGVVNPIEFSRFVVLDEHIAVIEEKNASSSLKIYDKETGGLVEDVNFTFEYFTF